MDSLEKDLEITINIVQFINPHQFYFKLEYGPFPDEIRLENDVQKYAIEQREFQKNGHKPIVGDTVSVFVRSWNTWTRAHVDEVLNFVSQETKYVLWALDKGISLVSTSKWILPLSYELAEKPARSVYLGGIGPSLPAKVQYNYDRMEREVTFANEWSAKSVQYFEALINNANVVRFTPRHKKLTNNHYFGDIEITAYHGKRINIGQKLVKHKFSINSNNFGEDINKLNTSSKIRWRDNDGSTGLLDRVVVNSADFGIFHREFRELNVNEEVEKKVADWTYKNNEELRQAKDECNIFFNKLDRKLLSTSNGGFRFENDPESIYHLQRAPSVESFSTLGSKIKSANVQTKPVSESIGPLAHANEPLSFDVSCDDNTWIEEPNSLNFDVRRNKPVIPRRISAIKRILKIGQNPQAEKESSTKSVITTHIPG